MARFAMAGGYCTVLLVQRAGVPFLAALPLAFVFSAALGAVLERTLYVHMYDRPHLDQVLFSIGLVFMAVAGVDYTLGSQQQFLTLPDYLQGRFEIGGISMGRYRLFIILLCGLLTVAMQWTLVGTRFGSRLRAAVDDRRVARGLGINVVAIFATTFRGRLRSGGIGRRARCGTVGAHPPVSPEIHDLLSDRRHRRRQFEHYRSVPRLADARDR